MAQQKVPCFICDDNTYDYIEILNDYICNKCEQKIAHASQEDTSFAFYQMMMKRLWKKHLKNGEAVDSH
ncbi:MAG: sigma factor G inhibitor Gin [Bacillota bacterium]